METFQVAFDVRTGGKQVKQDCAVCHRLSVVINGSEYGDGEAVTLRRGETHMVRVKDTPETLVQVPGGDSAPTHASTQKFTVWPKAVDGQTITSVQGEGPADSPQVFIAKKAEVLQYLLDNSEGLMAQNKDWPEDTADEPMNKKAWIVPVEVAVDANRDGVIQFAGNATASGAFDKTEESKPFRFWCNDDDDRNDKDAVDSSHKDSNDGTINSRRDLEDFSRLNMFVGGLHEAITAGQIKIGLKWKNTGSTSPRVKVWRNKSSNGGSEYLTDDDVAQEHMALGNPGDVQGGTPYIIPTQFWTDSGLSESQPNGYLLFEAVSEGKGQLCITFHKADGTLIGEVPGVWLDLLNVKKMYVRGKASENIPAPYASGNAQPGDPGVSYLPDDNGHAFSEPQNEARQTIVFVHGWRMPYEKSINWAETMYKRLWHRGFNGRFAFFRWPTFTSNAFDEWPEWIAIGDLSPEVIDAVLAKYNESEYRAWKSGAALKQFVAGLPYPNAMNICAHSMGNIVVGSALKQGMSINNYILMQAAVPSGAYNVGQSNHPAFVADASNDPSPDNATDLGYRGYLTNVSGNLINFYNFQDDALEAWDENNLRFKPDQFITATQSYGYNPDVAEGQRSTLVGLLTARLVLDPHESMAFVARSLTLAVGRESSAGSVTDNHDLNVSYSFGDEHSAQWDWRIQQLKAFYNEVINKFEIGPPNL